MKSLKSRHIRGLNHFVSRNGGLSTKLYCLNVMQGYTGKEEYIFPEVPSF